MTNKLPKFIVISIADISEIKNNLIHNEDFPTIDFDALLSIVIDIFSVNRYARIDYVFQNLIHSDLISSHLNELDNTVMVKLESVIYKLLINVRNTLNNLNTRDIYLMQYRYKQQLRNNCALLEQTTTFLPTRNISH